MTGQDSSLQSSRAKFSMRWCLPPSLSLTTQLTLRLILVCLLSSVFTGNGYIEGKELENFFQELEKARKGSGMVRLHSTPTFGFSVVLVARLENGLSHDASSQKTWGLSGLDA